MKKIPHSYIFEVKMIPIHIHVLGGLRSIYLYNGSYPLCLDIRKYGINSKITGHRFTIYSRRNITFLPKTDITKLSNWDSLEILGDITLFHNVISHIADWYHFIQRWYHLISRWYYLSLRQLRMISRRPPRLNWKWCHFKIQGDII